MRETSERLALARQIERHAQLTRLGFDTVELLTEASACIRSEVSRSLALEAQLSEAADMLGDVPGATLADRLTNYIGSFMSTQTQLAEARQRLTAETARADDNGRSCSEYNRRMLHIRALADGALKMEWLLGKDAPDE